MRVRILEGGAGSGNFGHAGRPGKRGGSTVGTSIRSIRAAVLNHKDGKEHSILLDSTGKVLGEKSGDEESVGMFETPALQDSTAALTAHHSHPYDSPPSLGDMLVLANNPGLKSIGVHSDTASYIVDSVTPDRRALYFAVKDSYGNARIAAIDSADVNPDRNVDKKVFNRAVATSALAELSAKQLIRYRRIPYKVAVK